jgi:pimeloyl-ACP methyl ester carboxylesterase
VVLPKGSRIDVPTGYVSFPRENRPLPPRAAEEDLPGRMVLGIERGGHFAALEQPDLFVGDVAAFVKQVRGKAAACSSKNNTERKPMHFARLP